MKLYNEEVEIQSEGNFVGGEAQIAANAHAFAVLSKGLYSNAELAIVRELCCNAWDSHVAAGNTNTFDLYLPNTLEPTFKVRDYGTGLSVEGVLSIYKDYFKSTKQQSDTMTGCFGLGAKSPYAYTKKFTTISYFNGTKYHFISFLNERGIPDTLLMSEAPTEEPNGLEIFFPVESKDFYLFNNAAVQALQYFEVLPNIHGVSNRHSSDFGPVHRNALLEGDGWSIDSCSDNVAIMGNVGYPLHRGDPKLSKAAKTVLELGVRAKFPLGAFEITPSRESVQWTEYTIASINDRLEEIHAQIAVTMEAKLASAKTYWEACVMAKQYERTRLQHVVQGVQWRGRPIKLRFDVPANFEVEVLAAGRSTRFGVSHNAVSHEKLASVHVGEYGHFEGVKDFFYLDYRGGMSRIENMVRHEYLRGAKCVVIKRLEVVPPDPATATKPQLLSAAYQASYENADEHIKTVLEAFGNVADIVKVSTLPFKEREKVDRTHHLSGTTAKVFKWAVNACVSQNVGYWNEAQVDTKDGGVYVEISNWKLKNSKLHQDMFNASQEIRHVRDMGVTLPPIVGVKSGTVLKKLQEADNWITVDQFVINELAKLFDNKELAFAYAVYTQLCPVNGDKRKSERYLFIDFIANLQDMPPCFKPILDTIAVVRVHHATVRSLQDCHTLRLDLTKGLTTRMAAPNKEATEFLETLYKRYPLLFLYFEGVQGRYYACKATNKELSRYVALLEKEYEEKACHSSSVST